MNIEFVKQFGINRNVLVRLSDGDIDGVSTSRKALTDRIARKGYKPEDYEVMTIRQYEKRFRTNK